MNETSRPSLVGRGDHPSDFVTHLRCLAERRPHDVAIIQVDAAGDTPIDHVTLEARVRALAARIQARHAPGERALLMLNNDAHYAVAYFACLYAGLIAVTAFPPETVRERHLARVSAIADDSEPTCLLTTAAVRDLLATEAPIRAGAEVIAVDEVDTAGAEEWRERRPAPSDIAFLQYTSGSTSSPKGVMVSHANLMANERALTEAFAIGPDEVFVSWLPLYHDMGLVLGLLQPIHQGRPVALMSPSFFLERPARWLEAISRHRGTFSGGPDFAYRLCAERINPARLVGLDLSSWRQAYSGAEPVRPRTVADFIALCAPAGFDAKAIHPCYGLAEATLIATGGTPGTGMTAIAFDPAALKAARAVPVSDEGGDAGAKLVDVGRAPSEHAVTIMDPETSAPLPDGRVGEVWFAGPSVAQGYWRLPEASAETFVERDGARLLRTGDLGFLRDGRLFIAGRHKDLIILRGQNIHPQDLERAIEAEVEVARPGRVAAFAVVKPDGSEGIGIAMEVSRGMRRLVPPDRLVTALSEAIADVCAEPVSVAVLLDPRGLLKTSSGKLQRAACRRGWLDRSLDAYAIHEHGRMVFDRDAAPADSSMAGTEATPDLDPIETRLAALWREVLPRRGAENPAPIGPDSHFLAIGGDSLSMAALAAAIAGEWNIPFPIRAMIANPRFGQCAAEVKRLLATPSAPEIAVPLADPAALSSAERRQWFAWRLAPDDVTNHVSGVLWLTGALDPDALATSWRALITRHSGLRTLFRATADGTPERVVLPPPNGDETWARLDRIDLPADEGEAGAMARAREMAGTPFDIAVAPPLRAALIRVGPAKHALAVTAHHIIADGRAVQVMLDELAALLRHHSTGAPLDLPPPTPHVPPTPLADEGALLDHWRGVLGEAIPPLALTTDHPRKGAATFSAARAPLDFPPDLVVGLRRTAAEKGTTLFALSLAAFAALLHRHTGAGEIRIGVPVANRPRPEQARMVGLFVNTVVVACRVDGRMPLSKLVTDTVAALDDALAHQEVPFDRLVEALRPDRDPTRNPLVQVTANHLTLDLSAWTEAAGVSAEWNQLQSSVGFELTLETMEVAGEQPSLTGALVHAADLFALTTMAAMAHQHGALLRAIVNDPERTVGAVDLTGPEEAAMAAAWGERAPIRPAASPPFIHERIAEWARLDPEAPALVEEGKSLNRGTLDRLSNRLAHRLVAAGIGPERRVGIAMERSMAMVVCLLATLRAGGAYVPLDPDYPAERLGHMIGDATVSLILTEPSAAAKVPIPDHMARTEITAADMDDGTASRTVSDRVAPTTRLNPDNLAYVIHTSGSTGRPKGVAVAHGPLAAHLAVVGETYGVEPGHRELMFFSLSFDAAAEQWMLPLSRGGVLALSGRDRLAGDDFVATMRALDITALHIPPAYLRLLAPLAGEAGHAIRSCVVGGEAWPVADLIAAQRAFPNARLVNAYGPTETVITPTAWAGDARSRVGDGHVPIGLPVGGRDVHILDGDLNPVPRGAVGELHVGGYEMARGYLGRPGLTAERFIPNPFDPEGGRLYRTGDRVRRRADGQLEYLGRLDDQVKTRGFRVELGEIEARLLELPSVREAVVIARGGDGDTRVLAYVRLDVGAVDTPADLRAALARSLPAHMLPNAITPMARMPLTPNGKIDRQALPEPVIGVGDARPATPLEGRIAAIWAEVLGVPRVGSEDNFFDLGGHSILLIEVHRLLGERLGVNPPLVELFRHGTVRALAAHLEATRSPSSSPPADTAADRARLRGRRQRDHFVPHRHAPGRGVIGKSSSGRSSS